MSPFCPTLEWEYPIELGTNQAFATLDFDSMFFAPNNIPLSSYHHHQAQDNLVDDHDDGKQQRSESPQGTLSSSTDHHQFDHNNPGLLAKKLNHNASERERRKKISNMYSFLRSLLPAAHHKKKLSIPMTVEKVVEYIPELQKEVKDLIHRKQVLVSKFAALQGNTYAALQEHFIQDKEIKPKNHGLTNETIPRSCSISANRLGEKEMVIQISAFQRTSLADVLLLLENHGLLVIDVSSFQSFGGITFYNIHLLMEGNNTINFEKFNEALRSLLQTQKQAF